jgi:hypothetical protein
VLVDQAIGKKPQLELAHQKHPPVCGRLKTEKLATEVLLSSLRIYLEDNTEIQ